VVTTFEWREGRLKPFGSHSSLGAASAELPQGSYTTLRTYGGNRVLRLEQHARRLETSLVPETPLPRDVLQAALGEAVTRAGHAETRVRITYAPPRLLVSVEPFEAPAAALVSEGVRCVTLALERANPHAKHTGFIATAARAYAGLAPGVNEALMVADDGAILEGLSSNFFAIKDGALRTEQQRVLAGVTREIVLEVAAGFLPLARRALRTDELPGVQECFVTSVSREILPVVEIDGRAVADGRPGARTRELIRRFARLVEREARPL
jgi:branched-subunit amino acid aminotransferase/4-amino-4-deoxychorismate lyase